MKVDSVSYTPIFEKKFGALPQRTKDQFYKKETTFRDNPFHQSLKTHKLKGRFKHRWSFSIDYNYRIVFYFISQSDVIFIAVGTHEVYK